MKKKIIWVSVVGGLLHAVLMLTGTTYVYKAVYHNLADIDDYTIFENRVVKAGTHQPWKTASAYNSYQMPDHLKSEMERLQTVALLVVQDGQIHFEKYWDGYDEDKVSNSFSVAKSIVSIATGIALREGKIESLDQNISEFIPWFTEGKEYKITIRDLLTMSSGLNWEESYISPISHTTEAYYGNDLRVLMDKLDLELEPGTQFRYKSGDVQLLSFVLEEATGVTLSDYVSEKLWKPIGAKSDALWSLDKVDGHEKSYCCFNSTARDFARLGKLYLNKGKWKGTGIVDPGYVRLSTTGNGIKGRSGRATRHYGYLWWIVETKEYTAYYARGILGQYIFVLPQENIVIVRLGHKRDKHRGIHPGEVFTIIEGVLEMM